MLIFVFVDFSVVLLLSLLCCYVVKLGKAKKQQTQKKTPQKSGSTSGHFYKTSYGCMCQSYCLFLVVLLFFLVAQTTL